MWTRHLYLTPSPKLLSGKMDHAWRAYREGTVGEMQGLWDIITLCDTPKLLRDYNSGTLSRQEALRRRQLPRC